MSGVVDIREGVNHLLLGAIEPVVEQSVFDALSEDLADSMSVALRAYKILYDLDSRNGALRVIEFNLFRAGDEGVSVEERHKTIKITLDQINLQLFRVANKEIADPEGSVYHTDLTKALTGVFEGRQY